MLKKITNYNLNYFFGRKENTDSPFKRLLIIAIIGLAISGMNAYNIGSNNIINLIYLLIIFSIYDIAKTMENSLSSDKSLLYMTLPIKPIDEVLAKVYSSTTMILLNVIVITVMIILINDKSVPLIADFGKSETAALIINGYGEVLVASLYLLIALKFLAIAATLSAIILLVVLVKNMLGKTNRNILITGVMTVISAVVFVLVLSAISGIGSLLGAAGANPIIQNSMEIIIYAGILFTLMKVSQWILSKKYNL